VDKSKWTDVELNLLADLIEELGTD